MTASISWTVVLWVFFIGFLILCALALLAKLFDFFDG
jgi:RsiW-degrading membrane proteinase PrsW (M82 family)